MGRSVCPCQYTRQQGPSESRLAQKATGTISARKGGHSMWLGLLQGQVPHCARQAFCHTHLHHCAPSHALCLPACRLQRDVMPKTETLPQTVATTTAIVKVTHKGAPAQQNTIICQQVTSCVEDHKASQQTHGFQRFHMLKDTTTQPSEQKQASKQNQPTTQ